MKEREKKSLWKWFDGRQSNKWIVGGLGDGWFWFPHVEWDPFLWRFWSSFLVFLSSLWVHVGYSLFPVTFTYSTCKDSHYYTTGGTFFFLLIFFVPHSPVTRWCEPFTLIEMIPDVPFQVRPVSHYYYSCKRQLLALIACPCCPLLVFLFHFY